MEENKLYNYWIFPRDYWNLVDTMGWLSCMNRKDIRYIAVENAKSPCGSAINVWSTYDVYRRVARTIGVTPRRDEPTDIYVP